MTLQICFYNPQIIYNHAILSGIEIRPKEGGRIKGVSEFAD